MKAHHYAAIGIRLFAVWLFLFSIQNAVFLFENIIYGTVQGYPASLVRSSLIYIPWLVAAFILWNFPLTIAKKIIPPENELSTENVSTSSLLSILVTAMSIFFLYRSIMDGVYWLTLLNLNEGGSVTPISTDNKAMMLATVVEFLAAVIMLIRSKNISAWARNL